MTIIVSVIAVWAIQTVGVRALTSMSPSGLALRQAELVRRSKEPILFTAMLVTAAVITFAIVAREALNPFRTYRKIALAALCVSFVPDIAAAVGSLFSWGIAILYMVMHIVAWAVTVTMLTRLTITEAGPAGPM